MTLMSTQEAAAFSGLHVETIRDYCRRGVLPSRRIGRMYLIEERDLKRLLANPPKPGRPPKTGGNT